MKDPLAYNVCFDLIKIDLLQVFAGIYPLDQSQYTKLRESITKLTFNDSSVSMAQDSRYAKIMNNIHNKYC
jgi:translation elongation factor EF-4